MTARIDWFREDFGDPLDYVLRYSVGAKRELLGRAQVEGWKVRFLEYDWRLNRQPGE